MKFIIDIFDNGDFISDEIVETEQRLFNETDLDVICMNKDRLKVFVRRQTDIHRGYYVGEDGYWDFGLTEEALGVIKRRI